MANMPLPLSISLFWRSIRNCGDVLELPFNGVRSASGRGSVVAAVDRGTTYDTLKRGFLVDKSH